MNLKNSKKTQPENKSKKLRVATNEISLQQQDFVTPSLLKRVKNWPFLV